MRKFTISLLFLAYFFGCSGPTDSSSNNGSTLENQDTSRRNTRNDSVQVLTLPTPMQIPALLRNSNIVYSPDLMLPLTNRELTFFKSGIVFGAYIMDMAYASSYSHQQASLDYFEACKNISNDLGLGVTMPESLQRRFKKNINAPDSLGRMILKLYDNGHKLLMQQDKDGIGLLMIMGCYMEGVHFNLNLVRSNDLLLFVHLLNQNKQYAQNLEFMLNQYEIPSEVKAPFEHFIAIHETLNGMDIPTIYDIKSGQKSISSIQPEDIGKLKLEVQNFRSSIIQ